jgi:hypothetical protein
MAAGGHVSRIPTSAARGVEARAGRKRVEDLKHGRLVDVEQRVARLVVRRRPGPVRGRHVAVSHRHTGVVREHGQALKAQ